MIDRRLNPKGMTGLLFFFILFAVLTTAAAAQTSLQYGVNLYGEGRWREAVIELRRAEAADPSVRAEALYWIALAELAAGEYEASIRDMESLELQDPKHSRIGELAYHRGRALFYLGRYDEAMALLRSYADGIDEYGAGASRKAAALYWIGECLFALGQLDRALEIFTIITEQYPSSVKYEASSYRIALINQKKIEAELLAILRWSHEESLKTAEEYQRRERSYDQTIIAYQKRIAELLRDPRLAELEQANADYQRQLSEAENRIATMVPEAETPGETSAAAAPPAIPALPSDRTIRLLSLKAEALELTNELSKSLNAGGSRESP
jgi:tetratricopeptide (TPR) repeat protein